MKQVISDEFRNLIRYTDDVSILLTKLFGMLSMILPYNVCFIAFTHLNKEKAYEVHTNINNVIPSEGIMQKLTQEFVEEAFGSGKPFVNIMYKTEIKQTEPTQNLSDYKQHICLPIKNFGRVIAALSFYWPLPHNLTNVSYYGEIEAMITQLLQNKVYNENVSFLSYKNSNIGLYNKMQFLDNLNIELARTQIFNSSISLAVLTFADYDKLSRQYGFDAVNIAIEKSIRTIIATLRFPDKVYRYDHKTLLILLVNVDKEKGMIPVNRILNILKTNKQTFVNDGVSMGAIVTVEDNSLYNGDTETFFEHILKSHKQKTEDLEGSLVNESIN